MDELIYNYKDLITDEDKPPEYPLPLVVKHVNGCYLIDENNNKYLDLTSCKENQPLGYSFIINEQENSFLDSEFFIAKDALRLEYQLRNLTGLQRAYFASSGIESYKILNNIIKEHLDKTIKGKILISASNQQDRAIDNTDYIPLNSQSIFKSLLTKDVGAVIIEIVQISDCIEIASAEYLGYLRELCTKNNALLIFDISAISPLRLGNHFLNFDPSLKPDIVLISKGLSQGIPFGAVVVSEKVSSYNCKKTKSGSSTLAYKQALKFIDDYNRHNLKDILNSNARYIEKSLNELAETHLSVVDVISWGMLFTIILDISAYDVIREFYKEGIIVEAINSRTIKISPPYIMGKEEIDKLVSIFDRLLDKLAQYDRLR